MKFLRYTITLYLVTGCVITSFKVKAQNNYPNGSVRQNATPVPLPPVPGNNSINYIRVWEPDMPITDTVSVIAASRTIREVKQSTEYYDGLGRLQQTVAKGISALGRDMVVPVVYDSFGREQYKYMAYTQKNGNVNDGKFKSDPFNAQKAFYQDTILNPGMANESIFYRKVEYEASSLGRILKTYSPGNSWSNHPAENKYQLNIAGDSVRIWNLGSGIPTSNNTYAEGELFKEVLINEQGNQIIVYKDKEGRIILKKVQQSPNATAHAGWLCTYYVYDNVGNLCFVIPPLATEYAMRNSWNVSTVAKELCYRYQYDDRNRQIVEERPGTGRVFKVYDLRDRLAFTQDSVQRLKSPMEWYAVFYDARNRSVMTAIYKSTTTREVLQANINTASASTSISYQSPLQSDLALYYDDGSPLYTASNSVSVMNGFDSQNNAEFTIEIDADGAGSTSFMNASYALPGISMTSLTPLIYMYYDDYNYPGKLNLKNDDFAKLFSADTLYPEAFSGTYSMLTNGLPTGMKVRVLGTDKWLTTTTYYNDKGRPIQVVADNSVGGKDIYTSLYSFKGLMLASYMRHQNPKSITPEITILTSMTYDHAGRLTGIKKRLNDDARFERIIASYVYDELGQVGKKRLGVTSGGGALDSLVYTYNIRGWLNSINRNFVLTNSSASNWFGEELSYDYGFVTNYFNGNIAGSKWKSRSDGIPRAYGYSYDKASRLTTADFSQQNVANAAWTRDKMDFSVSNLTYDANGGISTMKQQGMNGTAIESMDNLTYNYFSNTNRLRTVADGNTKSTTALGDFVNGTNTGDDYSYDGNGNITSDLNKNITSISYNHLNLPTVITVAGKGNISYQYDALGNKLNKTVVDNSSGTAKTLVTDYSGGFIYKQDSLELVGHEEGRIRPLYMTGKPISYAFDYFEKDHLGSTRMILTDQPDSSAYAASMESAAATSEVAIFSNIEETRTDKPVGYPKSKTVEQNEYVAKLNAKVGGRKIGPSLVLRVMAGDTVQISSDGFYKTQGPDKSTNQVPVEDIVIGLIQSFGGSRATEGTHNVVGLGNADFSTGFYNNEYQRLKKRDTDGGASGRPRAYLNFVLFDDQFRMVEQNSGVRQMKAEPDELQKLVVDRMVMEKSGFFYVYTGNETEQDVYFDNLQVLLISGPVLEETHYYPFGLTMEAISSNALKGQKYAENRLKFNGIESNKDLGLNQYDAFFRNYDPQIGRWWQPDPKPVEGLSLYAGMYDNPVLISDLLGDTGIIGTRTLPVVEVRTRKYDRATLINNLINEWAQITGLNLTLKDGVLVNGGIRTNKGISMTARNEVLNLINSKGKVYIDFRNLPSQTIAKDWRVITKGDEDEIVINPADMENQQNGTSSDLNPMTFATGMTVLHELGHTFLHNNFEHSYTTITSFGVIDEVDERMNQIRNEMGKSWGQRTSYTTLEIGMNNYIPMSKSALLLLQKALPHIRAASSSRSEMTSAKEMGSFVLPTRGVITTPK
ncbi:DUF6443 domain-containing protein [Chitinophaga filiformis]|uniref:RHS repeat-associated core domain-containing protein n=1 Tax=Chitinophaga filiformis TaxID=104663 RepID=A0A1G7HX65_CHIFI|nr:DUF6443 domain-containing protein [Chitinophaga filiformis]SDF05127.1 RHS repeat-associated core domain-containing protein [Chitinophaga filiformis]